MRRNPINIELLEVEEAGVKTGCSDWLPSREREMQPGGFAAPQSHEDWSNAPAITTQDVYRLAVELAQMREQISQQLTEIQQKLSQRKEPRWRWHRTKPARKDTGQRVLPFLPTDLSPISDAIENSKVIFNRPPDPSDDLALRCSQETWRRAIKILTDHALSVWEKAKTVIRSPVISAGPDGSVDLYWTAEPYGLLLNVPADPTQPATYFGDDATNPDSNRTSGKLNSSKLIDPGVLMWLAHTAEQ
ncbi:MAG: hypothetical protein AAB676_19135 [Verrucomicrobiota bacterium]